MRKDLLTEVTIVFPYGYVLKTYRSIVNISQNKLAKEVGCSQSLISRIENDELDPTLNILYRVSNVSGLPVGFMLYLRNADGIPDLQKKITDALNNLKVRKD